MSSVLPQLNSYAIVVMALLAAISVVALTVTLYKIVQFVRLGVGRRKRAQQIVERWLSGDGEGALDLAGKRDSAGVRVLFAVLSGLRAQPNDKVYARELATQTALDELALMARRMPAIDATVQAAPMLGLLGTVVGMIEAFGRLSQAAGAVDPSVLAGGIWTALITTAIGLAIAIFFYFVSIWLEGRIGREREALERMISTMLNGRVETRPGTRF
ncbi:MotA/TolQ/ExbB proton channel family protein [Tropicimonas sp. IMCC34011]|uniref:MotA/TolQ/ExbB proton channel family protein n=1 Tax=Tropicimonas sp. IMCC34011 TaxID=2248759 RepID=UPI000E233087|nr:MotA/TolQ/ExbB proton channel family protein [Tropicimonas sp. IMCC34011]